MCDDSRSPQKQELAQLAVVGHEAAYRTENTIEQISIDHPVEPGSKQTTHGHNLI
jgi:hypothetical protein